MKDFPREKIISKVMDSLGEEDVKAYFNREDPRHNEIVMQVSDTLHAFYGEGETASQSQRPGEPLPTQAQTEKTVDDYLEEIFYDQNSKWHKAYFDSGHHLHHQTVEWVTDLVRQSLGPTGQKEFQPQIFPIITKTGKAEGAEEESLADPDGEINDFINNFDFGGENDE